MKPVGVNNVWRIPTRRNGLPKSRNLTIVITLVLSATYGSMVNATAGPTMSPLQVTAIYTLATNSSLYVQFQDGSMPDCYNDAGGYLVVSNPFYKDLYAQLLMLVARGGVRAQVLYTLNAQTGNWGDCTIDGIYLLPE